MCCIDFRGHSFGTLIVEDVYRQPLGMMTEEDAYKEGGYTLSMYKKTLTSITKKPWNNTDVPWVVKFRFNMMDTVDPNGGTLDIDEYERLWREHLRAVR